MSLKDRPNVDSYGFRRSEGFDYDAYNAFQSEYMVVLTRRNRRWNKYNDEPGRRLKRFCRKGIPNHLRIKIWFQLVQHREMRKEDEDIYTALNIKPNNDKDLHDIQLDLSRTFPDNIFFDSSTLEGLETQNQLKRVLVAISNKHPNIGYCQGLNNLAGYLLLVTRDEPSSFWILEGLLSTYLPESLYTDGMRDLQIVRRMVKHLVEKYAPSAVAAVQHCGLFLELLFDRWILCLFVGVLPIETVGRVWDAFLCEGIKIVYRVAITLSKIRESQLVQSPCNDPGKVQSMFHNFQNCVPVMNCHDFMKRVYVDSKSLTRKELGKLREISAQEINDEYHR